MNHDKIPILDFGSQVTQLIARRVREAHVYCEIHPNDVSDEFVRSFGAKGIILSGSHASTYEEQDLRAPQAVARARSTSREAHGSRQPRTNWMARARRSRTCSPLGESPCHAAGTRHAT